MTLHALPAASTVVSAGCGDFLVADIVARAMPPDAGRRCIAYGTEVARIATAAAPGVAAWAQVCAASVAVAALLDEDQR
jgi:hypothetical protein